MVVVIVTAAAATAVLVVVISRIPAGYACPRNAVLNRRFPIGLRFRGVGGLTGAGGRGRERQRQRLRLARYASRRVAECASAVIPFGLLSRRHRARNAGRGEAEREAGRKEGRKEKKSGDEGGERRRVESESE